MTDASAWPSFPEPIPIDARRAWTAVCESHDERKEDLYYVVTLIEDGRALGDIVACVSSAFTATATDASDAAMATEIRRQLHPIAARGASNTSYRGSVFRKIPTIA